MAAAGSAHGGGTSNSHHGGHSGRRARQRYGIAPFTVTLFFVFMLTYLAIFLIMFCTIATTFAGMVLLAIAFAMTVAGYVSGA